MCQWNPWAGYRMDPGPPHLIKTPKPGVEMSPFETTVKSLEINENVNRARLIRHFLGLDLCLEQSYSFRQSPKLAKAADKCSCQAVVVMTL